ncbi:unnamed protein product [Timema podura]|uniref:J domain-containing protein n=1 Tax=Timema podura TaxID=61482 RepID=A0ABN7P918_TIMPD|nr:unnamed protein product [Timema podura]
MAASCNGLGDPYKILGVTKSANVQDIRKAYKQLAKECTLDNCIGNHVTKCRSVRIVTKDVYASFSSSASDFWSPWIRRLCAVWLRHPDKNDNPAAENKFVEINQAYELLTDPERRKHYDNTGVTENEAKFRNKRDYSQYRKFDPLDDLFGPNFGGFKFHYQDRDVTLFHKLSVTTR